MKKKFSIVIPVYGNEKNLPITIPYIISHLDEFPNYSIEIIMVCDGSPDDSYGIMKEYQAQYPNMIKIVKFTRNFGQGAAVNCGVSIASGDVIGIISADLQDPFLLFIDMLKAWEEGYKFVIATREKRPEKGFLGWTSTVMHKMVNKFVSNRYPLGGFDFYLMDKKMAMDFVKYDFANGSTQLLLLWLGYDYKLLTYERQKRKVGKSGWNFRKRLNAGVGLFISYSSLPLRIFYLPGIICITLALILLVLMICNIVLLWGYSIGVFICCILLLFIGGINFFGLVIIGEYLWRMNERLHLFPRYIIDEKISSQEERKD